MSEVATWLGLLISALSFLVAVIALVRSGRAQREANAAQRRIVEIEEQREQARKDASSEAKLRPELRKSGRHSYRLYLVNHGPVEARNIQVEIDDVPLAQHPAAVGNDLMPNLVGPEGEIGCLLGLHMGCTPPFKIEIIWDDSSGNGRSYCSTLTW